MVKCEYCKIAEATKKIISPNPVDLEKKNPIWYVCKICREIIQLRQQRTLGGILRGKADYESHQQGAKLIEEANQKLFDIAIKYHRMELIE